MRKKIPHVMTAIAAVMLLKRKHMTTHELMGTLHISRRSTNSLMRRLILFGLIDVYPVPLKESFTHEYGLRDDTDYRQYGFQPSLFASIYLVHMPDSSTTEMAKGLNIKLRRVQNCMTILSREGIVVSSTDERASLFRGETRLRKVKTYSMSEEWLKSFTEGANAKRPATNGADSTSPKNTLGRLGGGTKRSISGSAKAHKGC